MTMIHIVLYLTAIRQTGTVLKDSKAGSFLFLDLCVAPILSISCLSLSLRMLLCLITSSLWDLPTPGGFCVFECLKAHKEQSRGVNDESCHVIAVMQSQKPSRVVRVE